MLTIANVRLLSYTIQCPRVTSKSVVRRCLVVDRGLPPLSGENAGLNVSSLQVQEPQMLSVVSRVVTDINTVIPHYWSPPPPPLPELLTSRQETDRSAQLDKWSKQRQVSSNLRFDLHSPKAFCRRFQKQHVVYATTALGQPAGLSKEAGAGWLGYSVSHRWQEVNWPRTKYHLPSMERIVSRLDKQILTTFALLWHRYTEFYNQKNL